MIYVQQKLRICGSDCPFQQSLLPLKHWTEEDNRSFQRLLTGKLVQSEVSTSSQRQHGAMGLRKPRNALINSDLEHPALALLFALEMWYS